MKKGKGFKLVQSDLKSEGGPVKSPKTETISGGEKRKGGFKFVGPDLSGGGWGSGGKK